MIARRRPRPARSRTRAAGPRAGGAPLVVETITQHWRRIDGRWYRDVIIVLPDGTRRLYPFPEESAA